MIKKDKESLTRYLIIALIVLVISAIFVLFFDQVLPQLGIVLKFIAVLIVPFVIAWLVAIITRPFNQFLIEKLHFPPSLAIFLMLLLLFAIIFVLILLVISVLAGVLTTLSELIADAGESQFDSIIAFVIDIYNKVGLDYEQIITYLDQYKEQILNIASDGAGAIFSFIKATPAAFIVILVSLIAVFYWCRDEKKIHRFLANSFPIRMRSQALNMYDSFSNIVGKYIRAQLVLITITFVICTVGYTIIGVESPLALGIFTGVMDIIPILGPGTVIIPWTIYSFITGDIGFGIGLLIIYVLVTVIRYIIEPKVVGDRVGLHPLATLAALFVGMKVFGIVGLILGPITLAVIVGVIRGRNKRTTEAEEVSKDDQGSADNPENKIILKKRIFGNKKEIE